MQQNHSVMSVRLALESGNLTFMRLVSKYTVCIVKLTLRGEAGHTLDSSTSQSGLAQLSFLHGSHLAREIVGSTQMFPMTPTKV